MYFLCLEVNNLLSKVLYKNEEEVCIQYFRKFNEIVSEGNHEGTIVVNNYDCTFDDGTRLFIEKVR